MKTNTKLMLAKGLSRTIICARKIAGLGPVTVTVRDGITWNLDMREGIDLAIFLNQYEQTTKAIYEKLIRPGNSVVDVGANIGAQTLRFARLVGPSGNVLAAEPTDYAFGKLKANLSLNPELSTRVRAEQAVILPDETRQGTPQPVEIHSSWPLGDANVDRHPKHGGVLQTIAGARKISLDRLINESGLERVDFIKIDVDGFEKSVLESATRTFAKFKPLTMIEFAPYLHDHGGAGFQALLDFIASMGYRLEVPATGQQVELAAAAVKALCPDGASIDLLGRPILS